MTERNWVKSKKKTGPVNPKIELIKDIAGWLLITGLAFLYWMVMLLFASLVLLSYWNVTFAQIVRYSVVLMIVTSIVYLTSLIRRRRKEHRIAKYMAE